MPCLSACLGFDSPFNLLKLFSRTRLVKPNPCEYHSTRDDLYRDRAVGGYVCADTQVDLDLGNYERFLDIRLTKDNNITTGKIYNVCTIACCDDVFCKLSQQ